MEMEEHDVWESEGVRVGLEPAAEGSTEDAGVTNSIGQPSSDSSSDSDYDEQLARKIKQRNSYQGSDPDSFLSGSAAVIMGTTAAAAEASATQPVRQASASMAMADDGTAKLGTSMPINIPALAGRLATGDGEGGDRIRASFIPPHLIEQQKEAKLCATGVSITGMSPSTSLKRDRLLQRNAILRRTGFIETGTAMKGSFAEVLDPIKESRPFEMPSGGLSMALGSSPGVGSGTSGSLKEKHSSALSQALGTSPSLR